ncbi:hypothetical protein Tco_0356857 [Tanacetum coccineum]
MEALPTRFNIFAYRQIARKICSWWDIEYSDVNSFTEWINWMASLRLQSKVKMMIQGVFFVVWWLVWSYRNKLLFEEKKPSKAIIFDDVVSISFYWSIEDKLSSDDCSTIETTSTNNVGPVDLSSLGGCLPDANVTVFIVKKDNVTPPNSLQRKTGFGIVTSWREEDLIREMDLYMPIYQCRLHTFRVMTVAATAVKLLEFQKWWQQPGRETTRTEAWLRTTIDSSWGDAYIVGQSKEQGVPSRRQSIRQSDSHNVLGVNNQGSGDFTDVVNGVSFVKSHDFTVIHGSNIIIDETAARCVSIKRQRVCEPDSGSVSLPERIRYFVSDIIKPACSFYDCSTIETTSTNNVGPVDLSSLGGCLPDGNVTGDCSSKTTTFMEDVNVLTVSSANNCMPRADVTGTTAARNVEEHQDTNVS